MKKIRFLLPLLLSLTSCSFVQFVPESTSTVDSSISLVREEYADRLMMVADEKDYREEERCLLLKYLSEGRSQIYEASTGAEAEAIYEKFASLIRALPTDLELSLGEYRASAKKEINTFVNPLDYRTSEREAILKLRDDSFVLIDDLSDYELIDEVVVTYKVTVSELKTDRDYYEEELSELKNTAIQTIYDRVNFLDYRDAEIQILQRFVTDIESAERKEDVTKAVEEFLSVVASLKTNADYLEEERMALVQYYCDEASKILKVEAAPLDVRQGFEASLQAMGNTLKVQNTAEDVHSAFVSLYPVLLSSLFENDSSTNIDSAKSLAVYSLEHCTETGELYNEELEQVEGLRQEKRQLLLNCASVISLAETYAESCEAVIEMVALFLAQHDSLWIEDLKADVGERLLAAPTSLTRAESIESLANIIDFYAFYQKSDGSFYRDTFTILIDFDWEAGISLRNRVYWQCNLIRNAIGLTCQVTKGGKVARFHLTSHGTPAVVNPEVPKNRLESLARFEDDPSLGSDLSAIPAFDLSSRPDVLVWSSQQLWYSLQMGYNPVCVPGSAAEETYAAALSIVSTIIKDDMSFEQRVFEIYSWFSQNVFYDSNYRFQSSQPDDFPDEIVAAQRCYFAEGALLDKQAVCHGFAKAYLILLSLVGIEARYVLAVTPALWGKDTINNLSYGNTGYGTHGYVYIHAPDGCWYYSDVERCFVESRPFLPSLAYMMVSPSFADYGFTYFYPESSAMTYGDGLYWPLYNHVLIDGANAYVNPEIDSIVFSGNLKTTAPFLVSASSLQEYLAVFDSLGCAYLQLGVSPSNPDWFEFVLYYD